MKCVSDKRRPVKTPKNLVENGIANFGTFESEFENINILDAKKPTRLPNVFNKLKLTLWEACEIHFDEGLLLVAVSDMGFFGITKVIFFDYNKRDVYTWDNMLRSKNTIIAKNLINGSISEAKTKNSHIKFINNYDIREVIIEGYSNDKKKEISFNLRLKTISNPSVVSIPFGKNRPLYTEKVLFEVSGNLKVDDKVLYSNDNTFAIIDDHKGYYPRKMHYDWITTMGKMKNGEVIAFNLTKNQSVDPDNYNENLIWFRGKTSILPKVTFEKDKNIKKIKKGENVVVHIKDEHGMVDIKYSVEKASLMVVHALIIKIDYYITFGKIEGYIKDENDNKYVLDGFEAIGEDKSMLF